MTTAEKRPLIDARRLIRSEMRATLAFLAACDHAAQPLSEEHGGGKALRARTVDAITLAGYEIDMEFWPELDLSDC